MVKLELGPLSIAEPEGLTIFSFVKKIFLEAIVKLLFVRCMSWMEA